MFLSKLKLIGGFKTYMIGGAIAATIAFSAYNYTVYLNNKIDALVTDRQTLTQIIDRYEVSTKQITDTLNQNNTKLMGEINSLNNSFTIYEGMLKANKLSVDELSKLMGEIQNEQIQECLNTDLPDDIIERLFSSSTTDTERANSSK
ncbi:hypothetical protein [Alishewanella phage vB_AspM_Slickus01]|nr:hypothetical protein [Alishewanella phage vB_AspM_Slickus01]